MDERVLSLGSGYNTILAENWDAYAEMCGLEFKTLGVEPGPKDISDADRVYQLQLCKVFTLPPPQNYIMSRLQHLRSVLPIDCSSLPRIISHFLKLEFILSFKMYVKHSGYCPEEAQFALFLWNANL
jgi:hypothetical protein